MHQSRALSEEIYEQSPDAMVVVDETGRIERVNVQTEALFGHSRERMVGQTIEMLIPERLRDRHLVHRAEYMKSPAMLPMGLHMPLFGRRADGSEFPADIMLSPIKIDRRQVVLAVVRDTTERKRAEAHLQLLMRELNHRAKNMLSLVQAIARQTVARAPEDFMGTFTERIQALAANQDLLIRNEWQGVYVDDLVRAQLAHFADLIGARIAVHGPKLRLNSAAAQAIGLALHELATNAGKYGALSTDAGGVDVDWRLDGDIFTIGWTERNGPPVRPPERQGFGNLVLDLMARRTVDGDVLLEYAPSGLVWRLTSVASNALEPASPSAKVRAEEIQREQTAGRREAASVPWTPVEWL